MKAPQRKEHIAILKGDGPEFIEGRSVEDWIKFGENKSRDTWHKWIDKAPMGKLIFKHCVKLQQGIAVPGYELAKAIRKMLKGQGGMK